MRLLKNAVAGLLIAAFPVTASTAAVQSASTAPLAASVASSAALQEEASDSAFPWAPLLVIALAIGLGLIIALGDDDEGEPLSPG